MFAKIVGCGTTLPKIFLHCHDVMYNVLQKCIVLKCKKSFEQSLFMIFLHIILDTRCQHYSGSLSNEEPRFIVLMKKNA